MKQAARRPAREFHTSRVSRKAAMEVKPLEGRGRRREEGRGRREEGRMGRQGNSGREGGGGRRGRRRDDGRRWKDGKERREKKGRHNIERLCPLHGFSFTMWSSTT